MRFIVGGKFCIYDGPAVYLSLFDSIGYYDDVDRVQSVIMRVIRLFENLAIMARTTTLWSTL